MYRDANDRPEPPSDDAQLPAPTQRRFAPVPLGLFAAMLALWAEFFGMFLLAWGMAPTSIGCGAGRAVSMTAAMIPIAAVVYIAFSWACLGIMRDAHESQLRKRSFAVIFTSIYALGSIPLFVMAALFGSCFDF